MILETFKHALMITGFVFVMMLAVEYLNVVTRGAAVRAMRAKPWIQYAVAVGLGATPGCLGGFVCVTMYAHGALSFAALVGCMVATCGDEAFVLLAICPGPGIFLMALLFVLGFSVAVLTDRLLPRSLVGNRACCPDLSTHDVPECGRPTWASVLAQWRACSMSRALLSVVLVLLAAGTALGVVGPAQWNWVRVTLLLMATLAFFVVATCPNHFLNEHLWAHVFRRHVPSIFLWTLGALILVRLSTEELQAAEWIHAHPFTMLLSASLLGFIPESGPHLLFVTLFDEGMIPFSVLLASSIVQDGHAMLPLLSFSFGDFFIVKAINFVVGLLLGAVLCLGGL